MLYQSKYINIKNRTYEVEDIRCHPSVPENLQVGANPQQASPSFKEVTRAGMVTGLDQLPRQSLAVYARCEGEVRGWEEALQGHDGEDGHLIRAFRAEVERPSSPCEENPRRRRQGARACKVV
jgi:hypothetical protein